MRSSIFPNRIFEERKRKRKTKRNAPAGAKSVQVRSSLFIFFKRGYAVSSENCLMKLLYCFESVIQGCDQVFYLLDTDGETDRILFDALVR